MLDAEIYVDRIADMRITNINTAMEAIQAHEQSDQSAWKREITVSADDPEILKM